MKFGKQTVLFILSALVLLTVSPRGSKAEEHAQTIEIHAKRYAFSPAELTLKKGETVTLRLVSDDVPHSLLVPGLKINSTMIKGHPSEVTLTPETVGEFHGECGRFCGSGHGSMLFTVHVKD